MSTADDDLTEKRLKVVLVGDSAAGKVRDFSSGYIEN